MFFYIQRLLFDDGVFKNGADLWGGCPLIRRFAAPSPKLREGKRGKRNPVASNQATINFPN